MHVLFDQLDGERFFIARRLKKQQHRRGADRSKNDNLRHRPATLGLVNLDHPWEAAAFHTIHSCTFASFSADDETALYYVVLEL